jgi:hypothetical protein
MSTDNSICIFDLREPPERNKVSNMSHIIFRITCLYISNIYHKHIINIINRK